MRDRRCSRGSHSGRSAGVAVRSANRGRSAHRGRVFVVGCSATVFAGRRCTRNENRIGAWTLHRGLGRAGDPASISCGPMEPNAPMIGNSEGNLYRLLPALHEILQEAEFAALLERHSRDSVVDAARVVLMRLKAEIGNGKHTESSLASKVAQMHATVATEIAESGRFRLRRGVNATGVVLHTNLGRAPLSSSALAHIFDTASGYSNLELDLESG